MFTLSLALVLATSALSVSANCMHGTTFFPREEGEVKVGKFGYSGLQGPLNWGRSRSRQLCLPQQQCPRSPRRRWRLPQSKRPNLRTWGTTLEVVVKGKTTFEGKEFELQQFHHHTPSEHRINDEYFPLEIHMVHQAADESIAVIAVPFQLTEDGSTTEILTSVIENLDKIKEPGTRTNTGKLDFAPLIDAIQKGPLFQYTGSLTTPPCA
ncbi:alpha carbonic anhydrase [Favolaschia claudopus]|uniref:Carbonic anhydrase n=1 Tax=Favolaschia claudopus TaxID=2862362 RepID=A0AAW0EKD0_9AGAR